MQSRTQPSQIEQIQPPPSSSLLKRFQQNSLVKFIGQSAKKLGFSSSNPSDQQVSQIEAHQVNRQIDADRNSVEERVESGPPPGLRPPGLVLEEEEDYASAAEDEDAIRNRIGYHPLESREGEGDRTEEGERREPVAGSDTELATPCRFPTLGSSVHLRYIRP